MWVQMHNVHFRMMNKYYGEKLRKGPGDIIDIDVVKDGIGWRHFLQIKAWIDIAKPLLRGTVTNTTRNPLWISFKYERLHNFYFMCGVIKHQAAGCPKGSLNSKVHKNDQSQYGIWFRAPTSKQNKKGSGFNIEKKKSIRFLIF